MNTSIPYNIDIKFVSNYRHKNTFFNTAVDSKINILS